MAAKVSGLTSTGPGMNNFTWGLPMTLSFLENHDGVDGGSIVSVNQSHNPFMARTLNVGLIGYKFMGRAHSNAWLKADKFFDLKARPSMKIICGRDRGGVMNACSR